MKPIQKCAKGEENEVSKFDSLYKKDLSNVRQKIARLEANSRRAGKKGGVELQEAIKELDAQVKEADKVKAEKLRTVLLIERRKYCNFLTLWGQVMTSEIDMFSEGMRLKENQSYFSNLAASTSNLPAEMEDLINSKERTFIQIQPSGEDSYSEYDQNTSNDPNIQFNSGGSFISNSSGSFISNSGSSFMSSNASSYGFGTAVALYDFAGDQPTDLPFYSGDVVTITAEDDGSGWLSGELNGRFGIFPTSYVQRN